MIQVASGGAAQHTRAVYEKLVSVVAAHVDDEALERIRERTSCENETLRTRDAGRQERLSSELARVAGGGCGSPPGSGKQGAAGAREARRLPTCGRSEWKLS
jgi:hypothetical protein